MELFVVFILFAIRPRKGYLATYNVVDDDYCLGHLYYTRLLSPHPVFLENSRYKG